ncbi:aminotransferase class V-fold PLP-dependent enzyme [Massilia sp. DWR3-1-1]|uniref:aminotransferase class V-fold PLP-dependent enzyme n=1 Tax=Massilia sp. DWR3-1-1 TaxID=2804559 RepID=UPI003CF82C09
MTFDRRHLLRTVAALAGGLSPFSAQARTAPAQGKQLGWEGLASQYDLDPSIVNLENGYYGVMARPVLDEYKRNIDYLNRHNSWYLRRTFSRRDDDAIRAAVAQHAGVQASEIAMTRGATESLQNLIANYRLLKSGDTVMYGNLDYGSMQYAMEDLAQRHGATVSVVTIPEPASRQRVIDAYEQALQRQPRTRLLLLTHISHRTGLVTPVAEIVRMAKRRNVDVIVDIAQSWGQLDFKIADLGADFAGANLHKWIGAPLGTGFLYIAQARLQDIGIHLGNREHPASDIRARVLSGTADAAAFMTIPAALRFHGQVGLAARSAGLRALRDYWVQRVRELDGVEILTPDEAGSTGAVTSLRLRGRTSFDANAALSMQLADDYQILTVPRDGPAGGSCIRVTPSYYTTTAQLDKFVAAIQTIAKR